jgi:hypothetical protein
MEQQTNLNVRNDVSLKYLNKIDINCTQVFLLLAIWENNRGNPFYFTLINVYRVWNLLVCSLIFWLSRVLLENDISVFPHSSLILGRRSQRYSLFRLTHHSYCHFQTLHISTQKHYQTCFYSILKIKILRFCRRRPEDDLFWSKPIVLENNYKYVTLDAIISICWKDSYITWWIPSNCCGSYILPVSFLKH